MALVDPQIIDCWTLQLMSFLLLNLAFIGRIYSSDGFFFSYCYKAFCLLYIYIHLAIQRICLLQFLPNLSVLYLF